MISNEDKKRSSSSSAAAVNGAAPKACQDKAYTHSGTLGSIQDVRFRGFWFSGDNAERLYALNPKVSRQHHCVAHSKNLSILEFLSLDRNHGLFVLLSHKNT